MLGLGKLELQARTEDYTKRTGSRSTDKCCAEGSSCSLRLWLPKPAASHASLVAKHVLCEELWEVLQGQRELIEDLRGFWDGL